MGSYRHLRHRQGSVQILVYQFLWGKCGQQSDSASQRRINGRKRKKCIPLASSDLCGHLGSQVHCLASVLSPREPARPNLWIGGGDSKYLCVLLDLKASLYKYHSAGGGLQGIIFDSIISFAFRIFFIFICISFAFRTIITLGIIINALSHSSDFMMFIYFTLMTFQTWKYNIQPHIWTPEMITFFPGWNDTFSRICVSLSKTNRLMSQ